MSLMEELKALGADTDEGLGRIMGDASLYEMMLGMFVETVQNNAIAPEECGGDLESLIQKVHLLKGVAGNLSLTPLYQGYNRALELLRAEQREDARRILETVLPVQAQMLDCIRRNGQEAAGPQ